MLLVTATIYHATPEQTDSTPHITASGKHINMEDPQSHRWIAVSRDLEAKGYTFGVKVIVTGAGDLEITVDGMSSSKSSSSSKKDSFELGVDEDDDDFEADIDD